MVVGSGMLAKGLNVFKGDKKVLIFASGVSNSKETNAIEYNREFQLLKFNIEKYPNLKFIYFSTCSIFDDSIVGTPYVTHKIHMENYISENCSSYVVFRLPNVIGLSANQNTFFNFFKSNILSGNTIKIQEAAARYLIDMRHLSKILPLMIYDEHLANTVMNVAFNNQMLVTDIIELYEKILNLKAKKVIVPGGSAYSINNGDFLNFLNKNSIKQPNNYNYQILQYYLTKSDGYETNKMAEKIKSDVIFLDNIIDEILELGKEYDLVGPIRNYKKQPE